MTSSGSAFLNVKVQVGAFNKEKALVGQTFAIFC